jgi:hypothetical protein
MFTILTGPSSDEIPHANHMTKSVISSKLGGPATGLVVLGGRLRLGVRPLLLLPGNLSNQSGGLVSVIHLFANINE